MSQKKKWNLNLIGFAYQVFYLAFYAGYMPIILFLPLYLKYNGLSSVKVGLLIGLRPLLQSVGAPILVGLSSKYRVKKFLFIVSCILMIGKFFVIFKVLRPEKQLCRTVYNSGEVKDKLILHKLGKRADVTGKWSQAVNYVANNVSFSTYDTSNGTKQLLQDRNSSGILTNIVVNKTYTPTPLEQTKKRQFRIYREDEVRFMFITILILTVVTDCLDATIFTLVDNAYRPKNWFSKTWVWGDLAWGVMTAVIGVIMDQTAQSVCGERVGSFDYVFYFFVSFSTVALFIGLRLDFATDPYVADVTKKVQSSEWNFQYNIFILAYTLFGFCNGFLFTFVYWFIDELGGGTMIMGLSTSVECVMGVVIFIVVEEIIEYIGHLSAVCAAFLGYIGLFFSYYAIRHPWLVLSVKVLQASVSGFMMITCGSFFRAAAPAGSSYHLQDTLHGIYLAVGAAIGSIFSGFLLDNYRFRKTFLCFTLITCSISFLFLSVQFFLVCTEKQTVSDFSSDSSSSDGSRFGDDEDDIGNGYEEARW